MEGQKNSNCWYVNHCNDNCDGCIVYTQMKYQMEHSGLPKVKQSPITMYINELNEIDREAYLRLSDIRKNIDNFVREGKNLYICSEYAGNGKTSWAIRMLHTYFHYRCEGNYDNPLGMFVNTSDVLIKLKDFNDPTLPKYREKLETVDLVIFDDIGVLSNVSNFDYNYLYNVINNRMFAGKSNIFTSNIVDYKQLEDIFGMRLASRVYNASEIIELKGMDMR